MRKAKRLEIGAVAPQDAKQYAADRKNAEKALRNFVQEHSDVLRRDPWKEKVWSTGKTVEKSTERVIINTGSDAVGLSVDIDRFTPCLVERETGKIVDTQYAVASREELVSLKKEGWNFDWASDELSDATVYKLTLVGEKQIQGLVATVDMKSDSAIYLKLAESAPHNIGPNKRYEGVGGHLFAIAAKSSVDAGYGGFLYLDAKNAKLVSHYREKFGAVHIGGVHPYRMVIDEEKAVELLSRYTLKGDDT